jgi:hypothetical protein
VGKAAEGVIKKGRGGSAMGSWCSRKSLGEIPPKWDSGKQGASKCGEREDAEGRNGESERDSVAFA